MATKKTTTTTTTSARRTAKTTTIATPPGKLEGLGVYKRRADGSTYYIVTYNGR